MQREDRTETTLDEALADGDLRWPPSIDLTAEAEYCARELAELKAGGETEGPYHRYATRRLGKIRDELIRRRRLVKYGGPAVPRRGWVDASVLAEIKRGIDLCELACRYCAVLPARSRWRYRCPIHGDGTDQNPSGVIYPDQQRWYCFGCNSGGDAFDFLMAFTNCSFREAIEKLAHAAGIELPAGRRVGSRVEVKAELED